RRRRAKKKGPACAGPKRRGLNLTRNKPKSRPAQVPGGWGAEESGTRTEPNSYAGLVASQVDPATAEIGPFYELFNEGVRGGTIVCLAAPRCPARRPCRRTRSAQS